MEYDPPPCLLITSIVMITGPIVGPLLAWPATYKWKHDNLVPTTGRVDARWEVADGLGVSCTSQLAVPASGADPAHVNITQQGPCMPPGLTGQIVAMCMSREGPGGAELDSGYCGSWGLVACM